MKLIEIRCYAEGNVWTDQLPDYELENVKKEAAAHGVRIRVLGEVSWQRQLANMENPAL